MEMIGPLRVRIFKDGLLVSLGEGRDDQQVLLEGPEPMALLEWLYQRRDALREIGQVSRQTRKRVTRMSDVDIEIRKCIQELMAARREVTVESVQEALKTNRFFTDKGIMLVPVEWIEVVLDDEIANSTGPYSE